ncbi:glycosyltransferase family 4 protein [Pannus brasiliensis CCIBt3594]|uniref:Glycosyltransferase family 4 protein n=1 Tax=Pannus brasiliensis CCIBt3594 TaxID=1427578 RepID=A0AAW9QZY1_9CHRO
MKICLLSKSDGRGGGFSAAYRLHQGLLRSGADSIMLVHDGTRGDRSVFFPKSKWDLGLTKLASTLDELPLSLYKQRQPGIFSLQWFPDRLTHRLARIAPDILNLHWINTAFLRIETLAKFNRPIVWTLHDMWPFTGGCHYNGECDRYTGSCGACPMLGSHRDLDISRWVWHRKAKAWKNLNMTLVSPSRWLADRARASSLFQDFRIEVIPNGLDIQQYKPIDRKVARNLLGLPLDKPIVLFGAISATGDSRKGFHLLLPALQKLAHRTTGENRPELVVFGSSSPADPPDFGLKTHYLGKFQDDLSLVLLYSAADVFVAPSLQDNLPNTIVESLACGTPCVAFNIGGMPDLIDPGENGYLAKPFDIEDLAEGILWVLEEPERYERLRGNAREKVEREFSLELQAKNYRSLYEELCISSS